MKQGKIRAIVVDDEALGRQALMEALDQIDNLEVIKECTNGFEAVKTVQKLKPDLMFLDIQMPKLDGFDVVELLGDQTPFLVFVTAFDEYALRAFEAEALDYIIKPVREDRLKKVIERVEKQIKLKSPQPVDKFINKHQSHQAPLVRILIRDGTVVTIIPSDDIIYIEAQDDYIMIYTNEKKFLKYERISNLEKMLDSQTFCRIHRSYILNIRCLKKIEPYSKDSRLAILNNGNKLPISRSGYGRLMELM